MPPKGVPRTSRIAPAEQFPVGDTSLSPGLVRSTYPGCGTPKVDLYPVRIAFEDPASWSPIDQSPSHRRDAIACAVADPIHRAALVQIQSVCFDSDPNRPDGIRSSGMSVIVTVVVPMIMGMVMAVTVIMTMFVALVVPVSRTGRHR
jgi:hypothetical protein